MCAGKLPQSDNNLASQPTMSRLENRVTKTDLFRLGLCLIDNFINSYSSDPSVIILDCDDTNNDTYGQQELALFNTFYNEHCYIVTNLKDYRTCDLYEKGYSARGSMELRIKDHKLFLKSEMNLERSWWDLITDFYA